MVNNIIDGPNREDAVITARNFASRAKQKGDSQALALNTIADLVEKNLETGSPEETAIWEYLYSKAQH